MYKILIVDDEKMIRMGMKKVIPWENIGINEVHTAASGREALEILNNSKPEIMVTDIQMKGMTGLELINDAKKIVPELRVIVLTGYDNFEYARQSLRLQAQDFFLKPVDETDLTNAISKQVQYLKEQHNEEINQKKILRTHGSVQQTKLEQCMRNLIHDQEEKEELVDRLEKEFLFEREQKMELILIAPTLYATHHPAEENFKAMFMKNVCMGIVDAQERGITFSDNDGTVAIVYFEKEEGESVLEAIGELSDILRDEFDSKPKMVVGSMVQGFENLSISYNDAKYLLENEKENIRDIVQTFGAQNKVKLFRDIYAELKGIMCEKVGDSAYVMKAFQTFSKAAESYNLSQASIRRYCFEIASDLYFSYLEVSGEAREGRLDALSKGLLFANREEACEVTRMFIEQLLDKEEENVHQMITIAKRYIDEHLTEELFVSKIAADLYITPNYFSRLFKRVTGEGCNEYIVRKRIEKAKSLLKTTSIKTGKIAMMVGYKDTNYFSLAFKKHTGKSPTKYREEMQHKVADK